MARHVELVVDNDQLMTTQAERMGASQQVLLERRLSAPPRQSWQPALRQSYQRWKGAGKGKTDPWSKGKGKGGKGKNKGKDKGKG